MKKKCRSRTIECCSTPHISYVYNIHTMAMVGVRCTCFTFPSSLASFGVLFWSFVRFELQLDCKSVCRAVRNAFDPSEYAANMKTTQCIYMQRGQINTCLYSVFFLLWIFFLLLLPICWYFFVILNIRPRFANTALHMSFLLLSNWKERKLIKLTHTQIGLILHTCPGRAHFETDCSEKLNNYFQNLCTDIHYFCIGATTLVRSNRFEKSCNKMRICLYSRVLMCISASMLCVCWQEPNSKQRQPLKPIMLLLFSVAIKLIANSVLFDCLSLLPLCTMHKYLWITNQCLCRCALRIVAVIFI